MALNSSSLRVLKDGIPRFGRPARIIGPDLVAADVLSNQFGAGKVWT